jgi:hypothetical protein
MMNSFVIVIIIPAITLLAWILDYIAAKLFKEVLMPVTSVMMLDEGVNRSIRCSFICDWFMVDSYVKTSEELLSEIKRNIPDVVVMSLDLYAKIDWIEISKKIRTQFGAPVMCF